MAGPTVGSILIKYVADHGSVTSLPLKEIMSDRPTNIPSNYNPTDQPTNRLPNSPALYLSAA